MGIIELKAKIRLETGRKYSKKLRNNGYIPGIIYGLNQSEILTYFEKNSLMRISEDNIFLKSVILLHINKITEKVKVQSIQRHIFKKDILHIDFLRKIS